MVDAVHPSIGELRRLSHFRSMPPRRLEEIALGLDVHSMPAGKVLLEMGARDEDIYYLIEGKIHLTAQDGVEKLMRGGEPGASSAIARLRPSRYRVRTLSPIRYLRVPPEMLDDSDRFVVSESVLIDEGSSLHNQEPGEAEALVQRIYEDLNNERLLLPSLPDVAIRVGQAVREDMSDAQLVARIVESDPAIAAKLLKAANSARYAGKAKILNLPNAVARLGMRTTHNLVITFALRELFRSDSATLRARMQGLWSHSTRIASLSHILAGFVPGMDREEALLGGLVHDIGVLAVVGYAREFRDLHADEAALDKAIAGLRASLGTLILNQWKFPDTLVDVPAIAENWHWERRGPVDYGDLVILAQLYQGQCDALPGLPDLNTTPAYRRFAQVQGEKSGDCAALIAAAEAELEATARLLTA